jgi:hypothetical protein
MEVGQGPNWGCSAKGKKIVTDYGLKSWDSTPGRVGISVFAFRLVLKPIQRSVQWILNHSQGLRGLEREVVVS